MHSLARDEYYGRWVRINARELHEQMNPCSCPKLLLARVIYRQAKEISRVLKMGVPQGEEITRHIKVQLNREAHPGVQPEKPTPLGFQRTDGATDNA